MSEDADPLYKEMDSKPVDIKRATASPGGTSLYFFLIEFRE